MNMKLTDKSTPFRTVRVLRYSYCLFYAMAVWFGKPYRQRSYSSMGDKFEYFFGRFMVFIATMAGLTGTITLLWNFPFPMLFMGILIFVVALAFDLFIWGCRVLFVYEAVKRQPPENAVQVWSDKNLWEDD